MWCLVRHGESETWWIVFMKGERVSEAVRNGKPVGVILNPCERLDRSAVEVCAQPKLIASTGLLSLNVVDCNRIAVKSERGGTGCERKRRSRNDDYSG